MSEYNDELKDDMKLESLIRKRFKENTLQDIDKYIILNETQTFNNSKFSDENSIIILVKLIYLVNYGIQFNQEQEEQLFFRITKLFQSNNSELREMTYKSIKMIMPHKYVYVIMQCLIKDLMSFNPYIRLQALKFIPFIQDQQYIHQVERFIRDALLDTNFQIQSTALIVGIHVVNRFPNLVVKWLFEVVQSLDQGKENLQYHALILLHEIKKSKLAQFIKFIILMTKKQLTPLVKLQIIKFIKEILPLTQNPQKQELITYLFRQLESRDPIIFYESSKILINEQNLSDDQFVPINQFMEDHMHPQTDSLLLFNSLKYMLDLLSFEKRKYLLETKQISYIQTLAFHFNINISSLAILLVIKQCSKNPVDQLKQVYNLKIDLNSKESFLKGLREIVGFNLSYNEIVLEFIRKANLNVSEYEFVDIAIQIIEATINHPKQNLKDFYTRLIHLTQYRGSELQYKAIKIMNEKFLNIQTFEMETYEIYFWFKYLQNNNISEMNENQLDFVRKQYIVLQQFVEEQNIKYQQIKDAQLNHPNMNKEVVSSNENKENATYKI